MTYYPVLRAPGCQGWTTLRNFAPNNWEITNITKKFVSLTWANGNEWRTESFGVLACDEMRTVAIEDISGFLPEGVLPLLSLSTTKLPSRSVSLPEISMPRVVLPSWRATLGLSTATSSVSFQGEINPFPIPGSLLTFGPFLQFGRGIENFLILLNLEKSSISRTSEVEIYDAKKTMLRGVFEISNNNAAIIGIDNLGFHSNDLPLIICKGMSAIPLFFSKTSDGSFLSLEHTHPPAMYVVHGKRWDVQKIIKRLWFSKAVR